VAGSARDALREATEAAHLRLHGLPAFRALAEGRLDRAGYAELLGRMLGFHAAMEGVLAAGPPLACFGLDLAARRRAHLLRADLAFLGRAAPAAAAPVPAPGNASEALGMLYVTEGSTLGGRHLARALDGLLPPGEEGRRFLLGHGAAHGAMWRDCCAAIERCGATEAGLAGMVRGAIAAFAAFEAWFAPAALPA
jgi:heme oxygenase